MNLLLLLGATLVSVTSWIPRDVTQFWVTPDSPAVFYFDAKVDDSKPKEGAVAEDSVTYEFRTTDGATFLQGKGTLKDNQLSIEAVLPQGFFELALPQTDQVFGVASQPAFCPSDSVLAKNAAQRNDLRVRDNFFAIDSASTWLVRDNKAREELIANARRFGLATYRERLNWPRIEPQMGAFNFEGDNDSEFVRMTAQKYDMPVLELFHTAPEWAGKIGTYPRDLVKTADSWGTIGKRWNPTWNSIEVWNEPDISFSGNLPADQYAPILKTVAQEFKKQNITTPIVGGIIASYRDDYMDCLADNGVLDACDIFSFHTYCRAFEMETVSLRYHDWLVKNHAEWKPMWITECGRPWKKGTSRPNGEADLESAIDIVEKGVAAKALGIDAYFPFVYVFYEENDNNFGMSDRNNAPLRSCAGYARCIYLLSGLNCIGSWDVEGVERSYVFVDPDSGNKVAVLYSRDRKAGRTLALPVEPTFVERVTGERLAVAANNVVDFSDGFLYVGLSKDSAISMKEKSKVDAARDLRTAARVKHGADPRRNYSTVLRYDFDPEKVTANGGGYMISDSDSQTFTGKISVFNFDSAAKTLSIRPSATANVDGEICDASDVFLSVPSSIDVPARGEASFEFSLDANKVSPFHSPIVKFEVGDDGTLSFKLTRAITQNNFERVVNEIVPINLADVSRWRKNASLNKSYEFKQDLVANGNWGFDIQFAQGDRWAYPVYTLPVETSDDGRPALISTDKDGNVVKHDLKSLKGFAFTVKADSDVPAGGLVRVFMHSEKGEYYFTASGVVKTDGEKHFVTVLYDSLNAYGGTPDAFDPARIRAISIGGNSTGERMSIEIENFCFFK